VFSGKRERDILMQTGLLGKEMKRSTFGIRRSKVEGRDNTTPK